MKIALTADLHLSTRDAHPERFEALENIFNQMHSEKISTLVIAGDLLDQTQANLADFSKLCSGAAGSGISVLVVPGNHDTQLDPRVVTAANVTVVTSAQEIRLEENLPPVLLLPYAPGNMGAALEPFAENLPAFGWILVGHGDYIPVMRKPHPLERGIYMPLTTRDIQVYRPRRVFLGHIHIPYDGESVHYLGSPASLDPTETGRRRFVVYDLAADRVESRVVHAGPLRFSVELFCLPGGDELARLRRDAEAARVAWALEPGEVERVRIRVSLRGVASNPGEMVRAAEQCFKDFPIDGGVDSSQLVFAEDLERSRLAARVEAELDGLAWPEGGDEPTRTDIMEAALRTIYGA